MKNVTGGALLLAALAACHPIQEPPGLMRVSLALVPADVVQVVATVTASDVSSPITQTLLISGTPPTATGTIPNVPAGSNRTVTVNGFPVAPENSISIYRGSATTAVQSGQAANVSIVVNPVVADVAVTATFPTGDIDLVNVDHIAIDVSGSRILTSLTYYLSLNSTADTATGTASRVPVGETRSFSASAYDAGGTLLFSGSATSAVVEGSNAVTVVMTNVGGLGSVVVNGSFCTPDCSSAVCGSDGCNGSCGGCAPGVTCASGACVAPSGWLELTTSVSPGGRMLAAGVWDATNGRMIVFGGVNNTGSLNDVWSLSFTGGTPTWSQVAPAGTPPVARDDSAAVWDDVNHRLIVFGGESGSSLLNDVWSLSFDVETPTWTGVSPTGTQPAARVGPAAVWDAADQQMVVFGGNGGGERYLNDVWTLSFATGSAAWTQLSPSGTSPSARSASAAVWDAANARMILYSGEADTPALSDVWVLSLAGGTPAWSQLSPSGTTPAGRTGAAVWDATDTRMIVVCGNSQDNLFNNVLSLSFAGATPAWSPLSPDGTPPSPRYGLSGAWDPARHRVVLFGGYDGTNELGDTWALVP